MTLLIQDQTRPLVIIAGYYGFDNLGDEAILEELLNELGSLWPKEAIVVLSNNPERTTATFAVKSINRWHWASWISLLKQAKLFVSGGGGLFQDRTGSGSVIYYGVQILLARLCGTKVLIYAQGIGPLQSSFSRLLTRYVFQQASGITLRDQSSFDTVKGWRLDCHLTADPVWSLNPSPLPAAVCKTLETIKLQLSQTASSKKLIIGLSLRTDPALQNYHLEFLAKAITAVLPSQSAVLLLDLQGEKDHLPLKQIEPFLLQSGLSTHWFNSQSFSKPSQWLALMDNIDLLIGMRLHALLMSLKAGKPVIGIAYDQKVSQLLNDFGQPALSFNISKTECQTIWLETIRQFMAQREEFAKLAKEKYTAIKQLADKNLNFLSEILGVGTTNNVK